MAITLADAKLNTQEDYDPAVIDEFRKNSVLLDSLVFDTAVARSRLTACWHTSARPHPTKWVVG